jgi:hypothetical protein
MAGCARLVGVAASERDREAVIDAFAGEFPLPQAAVEAAWSTGVEDDRLGTEPVPDLRVGQTGPGWRSAVLAAWRAEAITADRAVELLHGQLAADELPRRRPPDPEP